MTPAAQTSEPRTPDWDEFACDGEKCGCHDPFICSTCGCTHNEAEAAAPSPDPATEPSTEAGRALLEAHRQTENTSGEFVYYPMDFRAAILAIEAEAERRGYKHGYEAAKKEDPRSALRADAAALPAAPAGLDVERLAAAMTRVDMGMYWNDEPRQIFDPPNMRRMAFNHAAYARDIAAAYAEGEPSE